jgi:hypothetical protein
MNTEAFNNFLNNRHEQNFVRKYFAALPPPPFEIILAILVALQLGFGGGQNRLTVKYAAMLLRIIRNEPRNGKKGKCEVVPVLS